MSPTTRCFAMIVTVMTFGAGFALAQEAPNKPIAGSTLSGTPTAGSMPPTRPAAGSLPMTKPSAGSLPVGKPRAGSIASGVSAGSLAPVVGNSLPMSSVKTRRLESANDGSSYTRSVRTPRARRYQ